MYNQLHFTMNSACRSKGSSAQCMASQHKTACD